MEIDELAALVAQQSRSLVALGAKFDAVEFQGRDEGQCSPEYPHIGELSYSGGQYLCRCGKRYSKDGHGGLRSEN